MKTGTNLQRHAGIVAKVHIGMSVQRCECAEVHVHRSAHAM